MKVQPPACVATVAEVLKMVALLEVEVEENSHSNKEHSWWKMMMFRTVDDSTVPVELVGYKESAAVTIK